MFSWNDGVVLKLSNIIAQNLNEQIYYLQIYRNEIHNIFSAETKSIEVYSLNANICQKNNKSHRFQLTFEPVTEYPNTNCACRLLVIRRSE